MIPDSVRLPAICFKQPSEQIPFPLLFWRDVELGKRRAKKPASKS
jgi:hypothetical protein